MDVSDGLIGDLRAMMKASGASAHVELGKIPLSAPARTALAADPALLDLALTGGDDYEIVCAVPPAQAERFEALAQAAGVAVARIGEVAAREVFRGAGRERPTLRARPVQPRLRLCCVQSPHFSCDLALKLGFSPFAS